MIPLIPGGNIHVISGQTGSDLSTHLDYLRQFHRLGVSSSLDAFLKDVETSPQVEVVLIDEVTVSESIIDCINILSTNPHTENTPLLICTRAEQLESLQSRLEPGNWDYLFFPCSHEQLRHRIELNIAFFRETTKIEDEEWLKKKFLFKHVQSVALPFRKVVEDTLPANRSTLLIVDDSIESVRIIEEILSSDYELLIATSGEKALDIARKAQPELIVMDIVMPDGMNGYEVLERLREDVETEDIPVIFISGLDEAEDEARGLSIGAVDYISKPYNPHVVRARIHNHLELLHHRELLKSLTLLDGLTRIPNRRHFTSVAEREWKRACREKIPLTLVLFDVDHFKRYNDHYGHLKGDECLTEIAQTLVASVQRPSDLIARYGGEEFVAVFPETDREGAVNICNRLMDNIRALQIPHIKNEPQGIATLSGGAITCIPSQRLSLEAILKQADERLYQAKREGRNLCLCCNYQEG